MKRAEVLETGQPFMDTSPSGLLTDAPSAVAVAQTVRRLNVERQRDADLNGMITKLERMCRGSA